MQIYSMLHRFDVLWRVYEYDEFSEEKTISLLLNNYLPI